MSHTTPRAAGAVSEYRTASSFSVLAGPVRGDLLLVCNICLRRTELAELSDKLHQEGLHWCRPHDGDRSWSKRDDGAGSSSPAEGRGSRE